MSRPRASRRAGPSQDTSEPPLLDDSGPPVAGTSSALAHGPDDGSEETAPAVPPSPPPPRPSPLPAPGPPDPLPHETVSPGAQEPQDEGYDGAARGGGPTADLNRLPEENRSWASIADSTSFLPPPTGIPRGIPYPEGFTMPHELPSHRVAAIARPIARRLGRRVPPAASAPDLNVLFSGPGSDSERAKLRATVAAAKVLSRIYAIGIPLLTEVPLSVLIDSPAYDNHMPLEHPSVPDDNVSHASYASIHSDASRVSRLSHGTGLPGTPQPDAPYVGRLWLALYHTLFMAQNLINDTNVECLAASNSFRSRRSATLSAADLRSAMRDGASGFLSGTNLTVEDADAMEQRLLRRAKLQSVLGLANPSVSTPANARNRGSRRADNRSNSGRPDNRRRPHGPSASDSRPSAPATASPSAAQGRANV